MEKAAYVARKLKEMELSAAAEKAGNGIPETLACMDCPIEHRIHVRTNNNMERVNRGIRRRTGAIGAFPDGQGALMPVCARLRSVAASGWGSKRYLNMDHLSELDLQRRTKGHGVNE